MSAVAAAAKTVVTGAIAVIGALTALAGIWSSSIVAALNTAGVIGVATLTIGAIVWSQGDSADPIRRVRVTAIAVGITAAVASFIHFVGRPMEGDELEVGFLTIIGVANLLAIATLGVLAWRTIDSSVKQPMKVCPMCAEQVLAAARICRYCGTAFDDGQRPNN